MSEKIYIVQIGDKHEDAGTVVYAGTSEMDAEIAADNNLAGGAGIRWSEWEDGQLFNSREGVPVIKWSDE